MKDSPLLSLSQLKSLAPDPPPKKRAKKVAQGPSAKGKGAASRLHLDAAEQTQSDGSSTAGSDIAEVASIAPTSVRVHGPSSDELEACLILQKLVPQAPGLLGRLAELASDEEAASARFLANEAAAAATQAALLLAVQQPPAELRVTR